MAVPARSVRQTQDPKQRPAQYDVDHPERLRAAAPATAHPGAHGRRALRRPRGRHRGRLQRPRRVLRPGPSRKRDRRPRVVGRPGEGRHGQWALHGHELAKRSERGVGQGGYGVRAAAEHRRAPGPRAVGPRGRPRRVAECPTAESRAYRARRSWRPLRARGLHRLALLRADRARGRPHRGARVALRWRVRRLSRDGRLRPGRPAFALVQRPAARQGGGVLPESHQGAASCEGRRRQPEGDHRRDNAYLPHHRRERQLPRVPRRDRL